MVAKREPVHHHVRGSGADQQRVGGREGYRVVHGSDNTCAGGTVVGSWVGLLAVGGLFLDGWAAEFASSSDGASSSNCEGSEEWPRFSTQGRQKEAPTRRDFRIQCGRLSLLFHKTEAASQREEGDGRGAVRLRRQGVWMKRGEDRSGNRVCGFTPSCWSAPATRRQHGRLGQQQRRGLLAKVQRGEHEASLLAGRSRCGPSPSDARLATHSALSSLHAHSAGRARDRGAPLAHI